MAGFQLAHLLKGVRRLKREPPDVPGQETLPLWSWFHDVVGGHFGSTVEVNSPPWHASAAGLQVSFDLRSLKRAPYLVGNGRGRFGLDMGPYGRPCVKGMEMTEGGGLLPPLLCL